jgi:hypothetical protein
MIKIQLTIVKAELQEILDTYKAISPEYRIETLHKIRDMTGIQSGRIVPVDLEYASAAEKPIDKRLHKLAQALAT